MPQDTLIVVVVVAIIALLIGFLIGRSFGGGASETTAAQEELKEYKVAVSEHFGKTADLVDSLTSSYKDVFEHLGSSAKDLLDKDEVKRHLESRAGKAVTLTYLSKEPLVALDTEKKIDEEFSEETQEKVVEAQEETKNDDKVEHKVNKA